MSVARFWVGHVLDASRDLSDSHCDDHRVGPSFSHVVPLPSEFADASSNDRVSQAVPISLSVGLTSGCVSDCVKDERDHRV